MSPDRVRELEGVLKAIRDSVRYWKSGVLSTPPSVLLDIEQLIVLALEGHEREGDGKATPEASPEGKTTP